MIQPGIYDFSNDDYHNSDGISRSGIMQIRRSPHHYWYHYLNPNKIKKEFNDNLMFGNMVHTYILEPQLFDSSFHIAPKTIRRGAKWNDLLAQANGKQIIFEDEFEKLQLIATSVKSHHEASAILEGAQYEKSLYWVDPATEILCKARPDILRPSLIGDLKTTEDASEYAFSYSIKKYGYHIQCAMQREASRHVLEKDIETFAFICIEKEEPYAPAVYLLEKAAIEKGKEEFMVNLLKYKECLLSNTWPCYATKEISLPGWAL